MSHRLPGALLLAWSLVAVEPGSLIVIESPKGYDTPDDCERARIDWAMAMQQDVVTWCEDRARRLEAE